MDLTVRAMAPTAAAFLGKPVVVENKGGGGGTVALGIVATAKPDGYTLVASQNVAIIDAALIQKVTFKPLSGFTPICAFGLSEHTALLVKPDAPWKTFKEFIDFAKKNPGKIKYSSWGVGSGMHVAMEVIAAKEGIKWVHVPFRGAVPARTALLGGHVDACSSGVDWPPFVESGVASLICDTHWAVRSPRPELITTRKQGAASAWYASLHHLAATTGRACPVRKSG